MNIAFGSFLLPSYRATDEGDGDVVRQWCECGTQHRDYAEGLLRVGYLENLNGYLFANRNGNPYSIGKVTEYGLWPALEKQRSRGRVYTLSVTQPRANRLSSAHRSRWYNASCVIATPELLFKSTGMLWVTHKGGP